MPQWNQFTFFRLVVLTAVDVYLTFPRQEMIWQIVPAFAFRRRSIKLGHGSGGGWRAREVCPAGITALSLSEKKQLIRKIDNTGRNVSDTIFFFFFYSTQLEISFLFC